MPVYGGSSVELLATPRGASSVRVTVKVVGSLSRRPVKLTAVAPTAATQSTTLGKSVSTPRNRCVAGVMAAALPCDCGWPTIYGTGAAGVSHLNASASIGDDGASIVLEATAPTGFVPTATSCTAPAISPAMCRRDEPCTDAAPPGGLADGRASWPMTTFFAATAGANPVIPWFSNFTTVDPYTPPPAAWKEVAIPAVERLKDNFPSP